ncbi:TetR/AcrR family transcriptional regulator [Niallia sp. Krafla_26]|uniref:TetR/AcrR family transcriptional regulator n=1 Tax=Niallia sp. Krafla_26 TaxID=3064703 RepID=UPI003D184B0D
MTKKQLILEKASELFAKQGFEATSVQQITDYCGISKGAFYLSFKSKDELVQTLIDQVMMRYISDIDHIVNRSENENDTLFDFYYTSYHFFEKHSDFAKIFIKEQMHSINEEVLTKLQSYNRTLEELILSMIHRIYGDTVNPFKYDFMYYIKSFLNAFSDLFLYYNAPINLELMCESLVEKTNLIASHTKTTFITEEIGLLLQQPNHEDITMTQLLILLKKKIDELEESIEKESLILIKEDLQNPVYSLAIIKGLIGNLKGNPKCKQIAYILSHYYQI